MEKIAIMSSTSQIGGTEISALRICNLLKEKGNDVVYISPGSMLRDEMPEIKCLYYKISRRNPFILLNSIFTINSIVKNERIDILHCQDATSCVLCCYAKKYLGMKARIIWHERGIHYKSYTVMSKKYSNLIDIIICNSHFEKTLLMMNQCDPKKVRVIYNPIEHQVPTKPAKDVREELGIRKDDFVVGTVGRQTREKGLNTLVSAVAIAKEQIPNLKLLLVGNGAKHQELVELARNKNIEERVILPGFRRDVPDMLEAMEVFCIPSLHEAFGNVTVEAMLAKRPVIASMAGGIPEVIQDGINGYLIPSADDKALAQKIVEVFKNREHSERMVKRAYQDACERYNFEKYYKLICDAYFGEE